MSRKITIDDLPFDLNEQESAFLLNKIPQEISKIGLEWGLQDSVFRDNLFEHIVKNVLKFNSIDEYYNICPRKPLALASGMNWVYKNIDNN